MGRESREAGQRKMPSEPCRAPFTPQGSTLDGGAKNLKLSKLMSLLCSSIGPLVRKLKPDDRLSRDKFLTVSY